MIVITIGFQVTGHSKTVKVIVTTILTTHTPILQTNAAIMLMAIMIMITIGFQGIGAITTAVAHTTQASTTITMVSVATM